MLYCDRINVSEEIDVDKTSESKECHTCCIFRYRVEVSTGCLQYVP